MNVVTEISLPNHSTSALIAIDSEDTVLGVDCDDFGNPTLIVEGPLRALGKNGRRMAHLLPSGASTIPGTTYVGTARIPLPTRQTFALHVFLGKAM